MFLGLLGKASCLIYTRLPVFTPEIGLNKIILTTKYILASNLESNTPIFEHKENDILIRKMHLMHFLAWCCNLVSGQSESWILLKLKVNNGKVIWLFVLKGMVLFKVLNYLWSMLRLHHLITLQYVFCTIHKCLVCNIFNV